VRKLQFAVCAAFCLSAAVLSPLPAHADAATPTTYYVSEQANGGPGYCSDTGPGTQASPFCEIDEAAAVATVPGDTVVIAPGTYAFETDITASGTAAAPITYEIGQPNRYGSVAYVAAGPGPVYGLNIDGASYIDFEGPLYMWEQSTQNQIRIHNSSHITIDGGSAEFDVAKDAPTVLIDGDSSDVTISREKIWGSEGSSAVDVATTGSGIDLTTDSVLGFEGGDGFEVDGTPNTVITSNTITGYCRFGISLQDSASSNSAGAVIENNVIADPETSAAVTQCTSTSNVALSAASSVDTSGTVSNYNALYTNGVAGAAEYSWAGQTYANPAAFAAATGQGTADLDSNPGLGRYGVISSASSPLISSANSDAPGELPTDFKGATRECDPGISPTGVGHSACYDRGAYQYTDTVGLSSGVFPPSEAPVGAALTVDAGSATSSWAGATISYRYQFGDGTEVSGPATTATHTYTTPGSYAVTVTAISSMGGTAQESSQVDVVSPVALTASLNVVSSGVLGVQTTPTVQSDWTITEETVEWGDGSSDPVTNSTTYLSHTYAKPGDYTVTFAVADADGENTAPTYPLTTQGNDFVPYGPHRLLDTRSGLGGTTSQISDDGSITLKVAGNGSIPADVTAVAMNLTAVNTTGGGFIQADTGTDTGTSTLNYGAAGASTNSVIAQVAANGTVTLRNFGASSSVKLDLIADVSGYFAPVAASGYAPITPARLMDTRIGLGGSNGKLAANHTDVVTIAGADHGALPSTGITAVELNVTLTDSTGDGYLSAYPDGTTMPGTSNVNWLGNVVKAANVIVPVGADGKIDLYNGGLPGSATNVVVDVSGYFATAGTSVYVPVAPTRFLDTRVSGRILAGSDAVDVQPDVSVTTATAFAVNATVTQTQSPGWLAVGPEAPVTTSTLNWTSGNATVANLAISPVTDIPAPDWQQQWIEFYNGGAGARPIQVIGDLEGYFTTG
jgi:PKD repeat protein